LSKIFLRFNFTLQDVCRDKTELTISFAFVCNVGKCELWKS